MVGLVNHCEVFAQEAEGASRAPLLLGSMVLLVKVFMDDLVSCRSQGGLQHFVVVVGGRVHQILGPCRVVVDLAEGVDASLLTVFFFS